MGSSDLLLVHFTLAHLFFQASEPIRLRFLPSELSFSYDVTSTIWQILRILYNVLWVPNDIMTMRSQCFFVVNNKLFAFILKMNIIYWVHLLSQIRGNGKPWPQWPYLLDQLFTCQQWPLNALKENGWRIMFLVRFSNQI